MGKSTPSYVIIKKPDLTAYARPSCFMTSRRLVFKRHPFDVQRYRRSHALFRFLQAGRVDIDADALAVRAARGIAHVLENFRQRGLGREPEWDVVLECLEERARWPVGPDRRSWENRSRGLETTAGFGRGIARSQDRDTFLDRSTNRRRGSCIRSPKSAAPSQSRRVLP